MSGVESRWQKEAACACIFRTTWPLQWVIYTSFPHSCNNVLLWKVISTCVVTIKWPIQHMFAWSSTSRNIEALLFQMLVPFRNSTLHCYNNIRPELNQISCFPFALAQIGLYCYCFKNEENLCIHRWQV